MARVVGGPLCGQPGILKANDFASDAQMFKMKALKGVGGRHAGVFSLKVIRALL
jgi:hypothetical protein